MQDIHPYPLEEALKVVKMQYFLEIYSVKVSSWERSKALILAKRKFTLSEHQTVAIASLSSCYHQLLIYFISFIIMVARRSSGVSVIIECR